MVGTEQKHERGPFWLPIAAALVLGLGLISLVISIALGEFSLVPILAVGGGLLLATKAAGLTRERRQKLVQVSGEEHDQIQQELQRSALFSGGLLLIAVAISAYAWLDIRGDEALVGARFEAADEARRLGRTHCSAVAEVDWPEVVPELKGVEGSVLVVKATKGGWDVPNSILRNQAYVDAIELAGQPGGAQTLLCFDVKPADSSDSVICDSGFSETAFYELAPVDVTISAHSLTGPATGSASLIKEASCPADPPNYQNGAKTSVALDETEWTELAEKAIASMN